MKKLPNLWILMLCLAALTFVNFGCCEDCDDESPTDTDLEENVSPETRITGGPSGTVTNGNVTFTWTGSDMQDSPGELVYSYRLDPVDGGWSEFGPSTMVQYSGLADGDYTFQVKARNTRGHEDPTPAQRSFSVDSSGGGEDTTPPETTITSGPEGTVDTADVTFTFTGTDNEDPPSALVYSYQMDDEGWSSYSGETSAAFDDLTEGEHEFQVRARDTSGNVDPSPDTRIFTVDTGGGGDRTPPETTITSGPEGTVDTPDVTFTYTGSDDVDPTSALVYSFKMDDDPWSAYSGDTEADFIGLEDGEHTFQVKARDTSGNVDQTPDTRTFTVDTGGTANEVELHFPSTTITGNPGEIVIIYGEVTNNMDIPAELHFFIDTDLPAGWEGSFCVLGVCVFEEITITMDPNSTEEMEVDFTIATDATSGQTGTIDLNVELVSNTDINDHVRLTATVN